MNGKLLAACDRLRDDYLPAHGIRLQDRTDLTADKADVPAIGLVDAKTLAAEKTEKAEVSANFIQQGLAEPYQMANDRLSDMLNVDTLMLIHTHALHVDVATT